MTERTFLLPDPGEGLEEAEILAWLVAEGDAVELNQPFVEVETAKAAVEIPSPYAGRIVRLHAAAGDLVRVGDVLVTFDVADLETDRITAYPVERSRPVTATPAVRRLAKDLGVDLDSVAGSGPDGRITGDDVEAAARGDDRIVAVTASISADELPVTAIRRAIAENLTAAAAIPHVTTFRTVDCTELEAFRRELDVSPLPVFLSALARVVANHRTLNSSWHGDRILVFRNIHVGVATDTERGLVVPVVRDAQGRGIAEIAGEIQRLAEAARAGTLEPQELVGSTISVSNTGSYGSEYGTPLLNPGNAVTVALGAIAPRALVVGAEVAARPACTLSLTFDHRVLDGAVVGHALTDLVACLQEADRLRDLPR